MNMELSAIEIRILGCLIEKERATPEQYPLTLNSLQNACNQKSNRNPMMALEKSTILRTLDELRLERHLAVEVNSSDSRVAKYRHNMPNTWGFTPAQMAIICELFVRGPQTGGDLRSHASRLYPFENLAEVERVLQGLAEWEEGPLVLKLPREAGRRESRWAHLFSGEVEISEEPLPHLGAARIQIQAENERIETLEFEVLTLRAELDELRAAFESFKTSFE